MKKAPSEPLRGEAAYRAERAEIARSNDAARAAGQRRRAAKEAEALQDAAKRLKTEMRSLPEQPGR